MDAIDPEERFKERFYGDLLWPRLTPAQQAAIGAAALELVVLWHGEDQGDDFAALRPFQNGDSHLLEALREAAALSLSRHFAQWDRRGSTPVPSLLGKVCRRCGCSQHDACPDGDLGACAWIEDDLCSACAPEAGEER